MYHKLFITCYFYTLLFITPHQYWRERIHIVIRSILHLLLLLWRRSKSSYQLAEETHESIFPFFLPQISFFFPFYSLCLHLHHPSVRFFFLGGGAVCLTHGGGAVVVSDGGGAFGLVDVCSGVSKGDNARDRYSSSSLSISALDPIQKNVHVTIHNLTNIQSQKMPYM